MADIISDLAAKAGVSPDMAGRGMGAVLEFCKGKLSPDAYNQVSGAVPNAEGLIAQSRQAPPQPASGGGIFGGISQAAGKLFGGGGGAAAELVSRLTQSGFSMEQAKAFLPQVMGFLKSKLPPDAIQKLSGILPAGLLDTGTQAAQPPPA